MPLSEEGLSHPPVVLCFSGSDPTAGAGLQADLLSLASMGCHGTTVVTAITVQDTTGVMNFFPIEPDWLIQQARAILEDMPVSVFKVGMVGSVDNVLAIADIVEDYPNIPLVLDPVLASGRGDAFARKELIEALRDELFPLTTLLTPNSVEARRLACALDEEADRLSLDECARRLLGMGVESVLITGTHENTPEVINTLYGRPGKIRTDSWPRLPHTYHGSGCTLASTIAGMLARGMDLPDAVRESQHYTVNSLARGFRVGMGQHLPDRFFWAKPQAEEEIS